jgi:hypothetical protein
VVVKQPKEATKGKSSVAEKRETRAVTRTVPSKSISFVFIVFLFHSVAEPSSSVDVVLPPVRVPATNVAGLSTKKTTKGKGAKAKRRYWGEILEEMDVVDSVRGHCCVHLG